MYWFTMTRTGTDSVLPAADRIAMLLREQIRNGAYATGDKLPDERALAKKFGVSRGTVRSALSVLREERLIIRQHGRGTFVSTPEFAGKVRSGTILVGEMVFEREYYFETVIQGSASQAARRGYMLTTASNASRDEGDAAVEQFIRNGISGVIMDPAGEYAMEHRRKLHEHGIPVVFVDHLVSGVREDAVIIDNYEGTFIAVEHLVNLGHRKLAYLGHSDKEDLPCRPERKRGFVGGCSTLGLPLKEEWIVEAKNSEYHEAIVALLSRRDRPTGIVCYNDTWATRVTSIALELSIQVPSELSVIGFDNSALSEGNHIPLTTIDPKKREMGVIVMDLLIDRIEHAAQTAKQKIVLIPELVERASVARISGQRSYR